MEAVGVHLSWQYVKKSSFFRSMPSLIMRKFCKKCGECKFVFPVVIAHVVEVKAYFSSIMDCDSSVELCDQL